MIEEYYGCQLPNQVKLSRELYLNQRYGILKDAAESSARVFLESASYAGLLNEKGYLIDIEQNGKQTNMDVCEIREDVKDREEIDQEVSQNQYQLLKEIAQQDEIINKIQAKTEGIEKYEITLINKKKAYLYVPVPLPYGEKERLKKYLDLILEERPVTSAKQDVSDSSKDEQQLSDE